MRILATPEKQKEYTEHFQMYYYTTKDLKKQLSHAERKAKKMPKPCAATKEAWDIAGCWLGICTTKEPFSCSGSEPDICCLLGTNFICCLPITLPTLAVGCAISLPIDAVNGICACAHKSKQKKIRKNLQSVEKDIEDISPEDDCGFESVSISNSENWSGYGWRQ
uniref:Cysteine-rich CWC n=1 Tax=Globodera pallida TaxID=36090 RepID=A0A183CP41_GLOPA